MPETHHITRNEMLTDIRVLVRAIEGDASEIELETAGRVSGKYPALWSNQPLSQAEIDYGQGNPPFGGEQETGDRHLDHAPQACPDCGANKVFIQEPEKRLFECGARADFNCIANGGGGWDFRTCKR